MPTRINILNVAGQCIHFILIFHSLLGQDISGMEWRFQHRLGATWIWELTCFFNNTYLSHMQKKIQKIVFYKTNTQHKQWFKMIPSSSWDEI
jgi:hypothetical protein